ncbi:MAG: SCO family protein [Phyllobacteriaceae bacterium]|jgi:protein SCO1/2|nr:SCO family protein [Phyllobacteriaceae bacterium]
MNRRQLFALSLAFSISPTWAEDAPANRRFMMEDVNGVIVTDESLLGRFTLLYFGYTHCPDVCPTSLFIMAEVLRGLGKDADRLLCLFATVDPQRDTAEILSQYVQTFDDRIVAVRGPKAYTDRMVDAFNAKYLIQPAKPDAPDIYTVDHTASLALLGPDGSLIKRYPYGITAREILPELQKLLAETPVTPAATGG